MKIEGKLVFKKEGDKKASEFLEDLIKEESKKIKLTVPFEASGTFEKQPMQPDGVTPVIVNKPSFEAKGISEVKVEEVKVTKYIKSELEKLTFTQLKEIGKEFGTTDRSKKKLIKEILELQK